MDCGVPFCHTGCPVNNLIPDWNDLVTGDQMARGARPAAPHQQFPRVHRPRLPRAVRGGLHAQPRRRAGDDQDDRMRDRRPRLARGLDRAAHGARAAPASRIAVVGSGPAGLACAQQLARMGHAPTVFEKADRIGGLLRYGIPDFKMDKDADRPPHRARWRSEGVIFRTSMEVGVDRPGRAADGRLSRPRPRRRRRAAARPAGAGPRPRRRPFRDGLSGPAEPPQRRPARRRASRSSPTGKHVVVIGGGDTGSDCIGTANRQGALSVTQLEILPEPPLREDKALTWPHWPMKLRTSSSQEEGCEREFSVVTRRFDRRRPRSRALECERDGETFELKADLVLLAMGFTGPRTGGVVEQAGVAMDRAAGYATSRPACSPAATCAAASRWWCGRSARAANAPPRSTSF